MNLTITIPKPCHEDWNGMTPDEKGRFCSQCAKSVVDFTAMPRAEVEDYLLANADKKVCGRFSSSQIDTAPVILNIPREVLYRQHSFRNMFMLALVVSMGSVLFSCKDHEGKRVDIKGDTVYVPQDSAGRASLQQKKDPAVCTTKPGDTIRQAKGKLVIPEIITVGAVAVAPPEPSIMGDIAIMPDTVHVEKDVYSVAATHTRPEFPGGINALYGYITSGLELPENLEGNTMKMYVSFIIEKDGSLGDIKVLRGFDGNLNAEVIRRLKKSPKWSPGQIGNQNVRVQYSLPVTIKAQE